MIERALYIAVLGVTLGLLLSLPAYMAILLERVQ